MPNPATQLDALNIAVRVGLPEWSARVSAFSLSRNPLVRTVCLRGGRARSKARSLRSDVDLAVVLKPSHPGADDYRRLARGLAIARAINPWLRDPAQTTLPFAHGEICSRYWELFEDIAGWRALDGTAENPYLPQLAASVPSGMLAVSHLHRALVSAKGFFSRSSSVRKASARKVAYYLAHAEEWAASPFDVSVDRWRHFESRFVHGSPNPSTILARLFDLCARVPVHAWTDLAPATNLLEVDGDVARRMPHECRALLKGAGYVLVIDGKEALRAAFAYADELRARGICVEIHTPRSLALRRAWAPVEIIAGEVRPARLPPAFETGLAFGELLSIPCRIASAFQHPDDARCAETLRYLLLHALALAVGCETASPTPLARDLGADTICHLAPRGRSSEYYLEVVSSVVERGLRAAEGAYSSIRQSDCVLPRAAIE